MANYFCKNLSHFRSEIGEKHVEDTLDGEFIMGHFIKYNIIMHSYAVAKLLPLNSSDYKRSSKLKKNYDERC